MPSQHLCPHPPERLYAWVAYDGTLCVCCCDCGKILKGEAPDVKHDHP